MMKLRIRIKRRITRLAGFILNRDGYSLIELIMVIIFGSVAIPGIVGMFTTVLTNSHDAEFIGIANMLAIQQVEIILADKAGSGAGYGYAAINNAKYANVNPGAPFDAFSRSVNIQTINPGQTYEYKLITVTVSSPVTPSVVLKAFVMDHSAI